MSGYRNVEDFIGDPTESELSLMVMRSEFLLDPFDCAIYDGRYFFLFKNDVFRGNVNTEALMLLGAQA